MNFTHLYTLMSSNKLPAFTHALVFEIYLQNLLHAFAHTLMPLHCHTSFYTCACSYVLALWPKKVTHRPVFAIWLSFTHLYMVMSSNMLHAFAHALIFAIWFSNMPFRCHTVYAFAHTHTMDTLHTSLHYQICCTHSYMHIIVIWILKELHTFAYMHMFALWHHQTSFTHSHMLICPCIVPNELHIIAHTYVLALWQHQTSFTHSHIITWLFH